ncbi:MAG: GGDEF domain-containing protein [Bacilli bacterium]|nr:GGDEF domain-containing protein [Bacilli bacterium]MBQ8218720.1 GGDEF domain-containing protein [Bacilli bacterium]
MKKRIMVVIGEVAQEYQQQIMKCIAKRATELLYDVIFICVYGSYKDGISYADGEKASIQLPDYSSFDGIIVVEDVIDITKIPDELYNNIRQFAKCPVVYLRTKRDDCFSILIDNEESMRTMTRHFIEDHGFTDICYMSGKRNNIDSIERLKGFMDEMAAHNIEVTDHMIFHGDFWKRASKKALNWFMEGRETFPQAIICANDYMAVSIGDELKKLGARIPEDVCISGMDNVIDSKIYNPPVTTMEVDFVEIATKAVNIIEDRYNGQMTPLNHRVSTKMHLRGSCGCSKERYITAESDLFDLRNSMYSDTRDLLKNFTDYQECIEVQDYLKVANAHMRFLKSTKAFYISSDKDSHEYHEVENESVYTDQVILKAIFRPNEPVEMCNIKFPRRKIIPEEYWDADSPTVFCVFGLHFKSKVFGYIVSYLPENDDWFNVFTQGYLITLSNAIDRYESDMKIKDLEIIKTVYHKDPLTGILNRRGYDKIMQEKYNKTLQDNEAIGIVSIDMDNLKVINDVYGHIHGDIALKTVAKALSMSMHDGDYCARVGGDEFAAIIEINHPYRCQEFKQEFLQNLENLNQSLERYQVGASIGICESTESDVADSLIACIQIADKRMYLDKQMRKAGRQ